MASDSQKLADENPYTFHKPSSEVVRMLNPQDEAKLIVRFGVSPVVANSKLPMLIPIQRPKRQRFGDVFALDAFRRGKIGDRPRHPQNTVASTRGQIELFGCPLDQGPASFIQSAGISHSLTLQIRITTATA